MRVNHHKWRSGREGERKRGKQKKEEKINQKQYNHIETRFMDMLELTF
jgi:hypothetical protein